MHHQTHLRSMIFLLVFAASAFAEPNVDLFSQVPADVDSFNAVGGGLNITYNLTDADGIDTASPILYYKTNTSASDCWTYVNGSYGSCGYQPRDPASNSTDLWLWRLFDNHIYPATYNIDERGMETTAHSSASLAGPNDEIKIELLNISNATLYGWLEVMANSTSGSAPLRVYYCNSSYAAGNTGSSPYCSEFYSLAASTQYNHSHSAFSSHMVIPLSVNTTAGTIGAVKVTSRSYFVLRPATGAGTNWNVYYIANISRANAIQSTSTTGVSWGNFPGTVDDSLFAGLAE